MESIVRSPICRLTGIFHVTHHLLALDCCGIVLCIAILIGGGQNYDIKYTGDLIHFAQVKVQVPFVDRLNDGKTPFLFNANVLMDDPLFEASTILTTGSRTYLSAITPPKGSRHSFYSETGADQKFSAREVTGNGYAEFIGVTVPISALPWPESSYFTIANFPAFGALSDKCFHVSMRRVPLRQDVV